jgi:nucleoside-diphosphate kinase
MAIEKSLILFKPDAVKRQICGKLLSRLEDKGLKVIGLKMLLITKELAAKHYAEHVQKPFYPMLESFITSGPSIAVAVEGPQAIEVVRTLMGKTNSRESAPGTIRGDMGISRQMNLIHGSDGPSAAEKELAVYFKPEELLTYTLPCEPLLYADDEK